MSAVADAIRAKNWIWATTAALAVATIALSGNAHAKALQENDEAKLGELRQRVHFAWQMQEFSKLDRWAKDYGTVNLRTPSGFTYLSSFYGGFSEAFSGRHAEAATKMWAATVEAWTQAEPRSATPYIANAEILTTRAAQARGTGTADTVFEENWKRFKALLAEARDYLRANREIAEQDPHFWNITARVNFLLDNDHAKLLTTLRQGLAKNPRYYTPYYTGASYLLPKWGGSPEAFYGWVDEAMRNTASDGTGILARLYLYTNGGPFEYGDIANKGPLWPLMLQSIKDELAAFPHWQNVQRFLLLSCRAHDIEEVDRQLAELTKLSNGTFPRGVPAREYCQWPTTVQEPHVVPGLPQDGSERPRKAGR